MGSEPQHPEVFRAAPALPPHRWTRVEDPGTTALVDAFDTVVAGAGPAGLTAAYELTKHGHRCVTLEADPERVGGISRTDIYKGYRFDIGGHRFFSKSEEINLLWREILGDELLIRSRLSRIYLRGKFFHYPLRAFNALTRLGLVTSARVLLSYFKARLRPIRPERSYEDWVVNRFGRLLFEIFFKSYTEKVWGIPTNVMSADWAAQRIKGLSLTRAALDALGLKKRGEVVKTLIEEFQYPRLGPGQMWEVARDKIQEGGNLVQMDRRVESIEHDGDAVTAFVTRDASGKRFRYTGRNFISTLPVRELIRAMDPPAPAEVREAAESLSYRDFLSVILIVDQPETFPDNWIYIHEPNVRLGRIQNFKNWSPDMVPDQSKSCLGLEYFCFQGDEFWSMSDEDLVALGRREIGEIGLVDPAKVIDGCVVRMPKAYPVYDDHYKSHLAVIRNWLAKLGNLELSGRNGMHKYNNQDHSMMTALLAARNILGLGEYDTWKVNTDAEYHETETDDRKSGRAVPRKVASV